MKTLVAMALSIALAGPGAVAERARPDTIRWQTVEKFGRSAVQKYAHLHRKWAKRNGRDVVGRQIVKYGMPKRGGGTRVPTREEWDATMATFDRWEHPPPPEPVATYQPQASASYGGGGGCTGMSAESGSAGYGAYNPNGGYIGCYQIAPGHYAPGGSCAGLGTDPAGQDACAGIICATEGPGAWTNPEGQNPCGRP